MKLCPGWLLLMAWPAFAAMDITRELETPAHVAPGQPLRVAVTFWTDSWFNPPPEWPAFPLQNGALLNTPLPNQLLSRQKNGISWSGIRLERQVMGWEQGLLTLPAVDLTLTSAGQPPVTVHLPALSQAISWPADLHQPDRFLPARNLTLEQRFTTFHAGKDNTLRAGDAIEREVVVRADNIVPEQIPQLLYAIPGEESQRLASENMLVKSGRGDITGAMRTERIRYLPTREGVLTIPPLRLRWWDTAHQRWQTAGLPGKTVRIASAPAAGAEARLRGDAGDRGWQLAGIAVALTLLALLLWYLRRPLHRGMRRILLLWQQFWHPVALPDLSPSKRKTS